VRLRLLGVAAVPAVLFVLTHGVAAWPDGLYVAATALAMFLVGRRGATVSLAESYALPLERAQQEELKEAHRLAKVGSWVWNVDDGDVTVWSDSFSRLLGRDPALPMPSFAERSRYYTDETRERLDRLFEETMRTGVPWEYELEMVREDGQHVWMWSRGEVERDARGRIVMLRGSVQDITDRKQAELQVHEKTLLLERAQQVGGVGSWAWYPGENREVWSEEARRIFGFTQEEAAGGDPELFYGVVHPEDRDRIVGLTWESFDTTTPSEVEYRILRRSDGALRWVREQAVAELDADGTPLRVLGAVIDITEQKAASKELERLAFSDPLTGLTNRTSFHRYLDLAVSGPIAALPATSRSSTSISTTSSS